MKRLTTLSLLLGSLALGGCLAGAQTAPDNSAMEAQQAENNRTSFQNNYDNLERSYKQYMQTIESIQAKMAGYEQSLSAAAKADPQYPIITKQRGEIDAQVTDVQSRHEELVAFAEEHKAAPSTADLQGFTQKSTSLSQDLAAAMTAYGKIEIEYVGLKGRHR